MANVVHVTVEKTMYCNQVAATLCFKSYTNQKSSFKIYHNVNCKRNFLIYLTGCSLCRTEYAGKAETSSYIFLNNQRSNVSDPNTFHLYEWRLLTTKANQLK